MSDNGSSHQTSSGEQTAEVKVGKATFKFPERYVGYYDNERHSALALYFSLPEIIPIEPLSIGATRSHNPIEVANIAVLAQGYTVLSENTTKLLSGGKLNTRDYGFGLRELPPSLMPGPTQSTGNPDIRQFLATVNDKEVLIFCAGLTEPSIFQRCNYYFTLPDYVVKIDIPFKYLPAWSRILSSTTSYTESHIAR